MAEHPLKRVATDLVEGVGRDAAAVSTRLLGEQGGPDGRKVGRAAMIAHVRAIWPYPAMRDALLKRLVATTPNPYAKDPAGLDAELPARNGVEHAEQILKDAFPNGWPEPAPPPVTGGAGFAPTNGVPY